MVEAGNDQEDRRRKSDAEPIEAAANQKAKQRRYRETQPESPQFKLEVCTSRPADPRTRLGGA